MHEKLADVLRSIHTAQNAEDLAQRLEAIFSAYGYGHYTYLLVSSPAAAAAPSAAPQASDIHWLSNLSPEWVRHYDKERYARIDPIIRDCATSRLPIRWTEGYRAGTRTKGECRVMEDAWENGIKRGCTVPLHGPGELGILSLISERNETEFQKTSEDSKFEIQLIAQHFHDAARYLLTKSQGPRFRHALVEKQQGGLKIYPYGPTYYD